MDYPLEVESGRAMKRVRVLIFRIFILSFFLVAFNGPPASSGEESLKANLDLPFDAAGSSEKEEENAPDIIVFYGSVYEADAVVFCLDESLSMRNANRWELQRKEASRAISELDERSEMGIVFYGQNAYSFRESLVTATTTNKAAALSFVNSRNLTLGTCLGPGVIKSLEMLQRSTNKYRSVIVAGDGRPTVCPYVRGRGQDEQLFNEIFQKTLSANPGAQIRVHTIYVGTDNDPKAISFMRRLAEIHNGTFRIVNQ